MTIKEFKDLSLDDLATLTALDKTRWCKYFNGQLMTESVLNSLAQSLGMEPHILLLAINQRRLHRNAINAKLNSIA
ncbi:MAG: hypothetical protein AUK48_02115 [Oscillatoriales cyanobacterium CG2_30_44_21]|nr:MAG: hypothetical protein AUK48_02115 [Oscillatoriales cyanobacterium CG2_30_44_21]